MVVVLTDSCSMTLLAVSGKGLTTVVGFNCGHTYHASCLKGGFCMICTALDAKERGKKNLVRIFEL